MSSLAVSIEFESKNMLNKNSNNPLYRSVFNNIKSLPAFVTFALLSIVNVAQAADVERGGQLAQTCLGCHGAPGLRNPGPVFQIPMVGGQHAEYIVAALQAYKKEDRPHGTMRAQAASLSDKDMTDIAAFFAAMDGNSRPSIENDVLVAQGKELVKEKNCHTCHGQTGDGPSPAFPKLAGQYKSYLVHSLKEYRSGERNNAIMNGQAKGLTIRDIEALSAYFASQEGGLSAPQSTIFK